MKAEDLPINEFIPKLRYSLTLVACIMALVFCYTTISITVNIVFSLDQHLKAWYMATMLGVLIVCAAGWMLSQGKVGVLPYCKLAVLLCFIVHLCLLVLGGAELNSYPPTSALVFLSLNSLSLWLLNSRLAYVSALILRRLHRRKRKVLKYMETVNQQC